MDSENIHFSTKVNLLVNFNKWISFWKKEIQKDWGVCSQYVEDH